MSTKTSGTGFRFSRVMAWAPAVIVLAGFVLILGDQMATGLLTAVAGIVFWFIVRRRKAVATAEAPPAS